MGAWNPNLRASALILIVLMIVSPKIIASETMVRPFEANCTRSLRISGAYGVRRCETPTSGEEMV
jgi:hypothetical protein